MNVHSVNHIWNTNKLRVWIKVKFLPANVKDSAYHSGEKDSE